MTDRILHTGEGRVLVGFTLDELEDIAASCPSVKVCKRIIAAIRLLDAARAERLESEVL